MLFNSQFFASVVRFIFYSVFGGFCCIPSDGCHFRDPNKSLKNPTSQEVGWRDVLPENRWRPWIGRGDKNRGFLTNGRIHPSGLIDSWAKNPSKRIILITTPDMRYYHRKHFHVNHKWFNAPITNLVIATVYYYEYSAVVNPAIAMLQWVLPGRLGCSLCWPSTRSISHGSLRTRMETDFQSHQSLAKAEKRWETVWNKYKHVRTYWDHLKVGGSIKSTYTSKHKINGS